MTDPNVFNNIIRQTELKAELTRAFQDLDSILVEHAGPFATSAVIGSRFRQVSDIDELTKDGIKILRHLIVSEDPADRFAARMVRFIGIAVDKRCHDGTTTSMLLFCRLALVAMEKMKSPLLSSERYRWTKTITTYLTKCLDYLDTLKITEDDLLERVNQYGLDTSIEEIRGAIAFHMAMISSKGDYDLSTKVAQVIKSSPKKIYGMFRDTNLAVETDEPYLLKTQDYDLSVNANIGNLNDLNYKSDTQYLAENAVIFATGNEIVTGAFEAEFLRAFISTNPRVRNDLEPDFGTPHGWEHYHDNKRHLIILTPMLNDFELIQDINIFNANNPHIKISWFHYQVHARLKTSFNKTLHYMAGTDLFNDVQSKDATRCLIGLNTDGVKVSAIGHVLTFTNLYEKTKGEYYHPLYLAPEVFPPYTKFKEETEALIEFANANITNPALDHEELTHLISLYRSLTCQEIMEIEVGGSAHDQYANKTVYEDAMGAALSAVNEGVILGGYAHLAKWMHDQLETSDPMVMAFQRAFQSIVLDSLRVSNVDGYTQDLIKEGLDSKWAYVVADATKYLTSDIPTDYVIRKELDKQAMIEFLKCSANYPVLLQAYGGYHEQFKRFRDILPRLANTSNLVDMRIRDEDADVR